MSKRKNIKKGCEMEYEKIKQKLLSEKLRLKAQNKVLLKIIGGVTYYKLTPDFKTSRRKGEENDHNQLDHITRMKKS